MLIGRRRLLVGAGALAVFPSIAKAALPDEIAGQIAFRIIRDGDVIGSHVLQIVRDGSSLAVQIAVDIVVKFGPIALFRYKLRGVEQWRDGLVSSIHADTNDDGTKAYIRAEREGDGLWVQGSKAPRYRAPDDAIPATHWNMAELNGPWINPQDGRLLRPQVAPRGQEPVALADGEKVPANRYDLSGDAVLDLWYDTKAQWTALSFKAGDGSMIRYERL